MQISYQCSEMWFHVVIHLPQFFTVSRVLWLWMERDVDWDVSQFLTTKLKEDWDRHSWSLAQRSQPLTGWAKRLLVPLFMYRGGIYMNTVTANEKRVMNTPQLYNASDQFWHNCFRHTSQCLSSKIGRLYRGCRDGSTQTDMLHFKVRRNVTMWLRR